MPAPLPVDLRQRILTAYEAKEGSQRQIAERFKVSLSFIRDLLRHYWETDILRPKPRGEEQLPRSIRGKTRLSDGCLTKVVDS